MTYALVAAFSFMIGAVLMGCVTLAKWADNDLDVMRKKRGFDAFDYE